MKGAEELRFYGCKPPSSQVLHGLALRANTQPILANLQRTMFQVYPVADSGYIDFVHSRPEMKVIIGELDVALAAIALVSLYYLYRDHL